MAVLQLQLRNDTASNWTTANPTLLEGEFGLETNTGKYKIGDGSTAWNSLSYGGSYLSGQPMGARMTFSTTTTAGDPGNGFFRLNNATWGTVTRIYIDLLDTGGTDLTTWIDSWDDSTSTLKGHLHFTEIGGTGFMTFAVTAVTTQTGYREITVSPLAGSVPANNSNWGVLFAPAGYKGTDGTNGDKAFVYIAYASDSSGTGFTTTYDAALEYIAIKSTTTVIASPSASDFTGLWKRYSNRYPSVQSVSSSATVTPTSADDMVKVTAQAAGLTLANPTGTFTEGQVLIIRIKDNGTSRSLTYGTNYRAFGQALPTSTVVSKTLYLTCVYNSTDTKFDVTFVKEV